MTRRIEKIPPVRRAKGGRFVATLCSDPNCGGILQLEQDRSWDGHVTNWWRCDGLTYEGDHDELEACPRCEEGT